MKSKLVIGAATILLILLFAYASWAKLTDYSDFKFSLTESPFIASFAGILAWAVPAIEIGIVVLLIVPSLRLMGLYASLVLMSLFTIYIAAMLAFAADVPCSCGGILEEMSWGTHIVFNSFFVLISAWAIWLKNKQKRISVLAESKLINH